MSDWLCPQCGLRLSYGTYCKGCEVEFTFSWRPMTELEVVAHRASAVIAEIHERQREEFVSAYEAIGWPAP